MREKAQNGSVRFTALVEQAGKPEQVTLWRDPKQDPDFRKAINENRVLTVHQENVGTKKDFGVVGYEPGVLGSYLVFPKRLGQVEGQRIVGIKYDLLAPTKSKGKTVRIPLPQKKPEKPHHK